MPKMCVYVVSTKYLNRTSAEEPHCQVDQLLGSGTDNYVFKIERDAVMIKVELGDGCSQPFVP